MKRQKAERAGRQGEFRAAMFLRLQGWQILAERVKTPQGEIDLIARRNGVVAFVEVKWRKRREDLDHAIDEYRLRRVAAAVEAVAQEYVRDSEDMRIDVILLAPASIPRHITNAWMP
jgi:putative endonuclease